MKINDIIRIEYHWLDDSEYEIIGKITGNSTGHSYGNATYVKILKVVSNTGNYTDLIVNTTKSYPRTLFDEKYYKIEKLNENEFPEYFI